MSKTPNSELLTGLESTQTPRKNRLFEAGHMKLVVLHLISLAPKHGYEIIKEIVRSLVVVTPQAQVRFIQH